MIIKVDISAKLKSNNEFVEYQVSVDKKFSKNENFLDQLHEFVDDFLEIKHGDNIKWSSFSVCKRDSGTELNIRYLTEFGIRESIVNIKDLAEFILKFKVISIETVFGLDKDNLILK